MSWVNDKADKGLEFIRDVRAQQVYPHFREFESGGIRTTIDGKPIVNFSSNDYLGLSNHPKAKEAAKKAIDRFACGLSSSRVQATTTEHVALEERLAEWFGFDTCLPFTSGYEAMVGTLQALCDFDSMLIMDNLAHAGILGGSFLADGTPLDMLPLFIRGLAEGSKDLAEHDIAGIADARRMVLTPGEAEAELEKLSLDQEFQKRLFGKDEPGHNEAVERQRELMLMGGKT